MARRLGGGMSSGDRRTLGTAVDIVLRVLVAAGLAIEAFVHSDLAANYDSNAATISQGDLFRIEAGVAGLAALIVLVIGRWPGFGFAFLVAAGGLGAVLLYRYVNVGKFGPFPNMYEPVWYGEKIASAMAQGAAALLALVGGGAAWWRSRSALLRR